jgi:Domain of unknown function (DUF1792).
VASVKQKIPNVVVWGAGARCQIVMSAIRKDKCTLKGIVDTNQALYHQYMECWQIEAPELLIDNTVDYIIISTCFGETIWKQCEEMGICKDKIIDYWKTDTKYEFIDETVKKIFELEREIVILKRRIENMPYELGLKPCPEIRSSEELLLKIIREKNSLCRFGDGELELMQNKERPWFQEVNGQLAKRLKEVFYCKNEKIIIALANNFGSLDYYTEDAADGIRSYLSQGSRERLMSIIDINRTYYDAYVSRPYLIYRKKNRAKDIFKLFQRVWKNREVLLVEGTYACIGVKNDLFQNVVDLRRIIAPDKNAFSVYDKILEVIHKNIDKDTLVLISLGPTATVLAYDLAMKGIQSIDIGQLDNEYEWYIRGVDERVEIPGKCVSELISYRIPDRIADDIYERQIVARIEN